MALTNVKNGKRKPKNRANKINLVFDEEKRRDFLTGFRKRKLQRKKQAQEKLENELKEERRRLKTEAKESYKKLVVSHRPIPELEHLLAEEYEDDDVTVKVVELSANNIAKENNWIGANQPKYETDNEENEDSGKESETEEVPGMELKRKPPVSKKEAKLRKFDSEKDLKKELKKQATKNVKKSKVFQKKSQIERQKQKKQSFRLKKQKEVVRQKMGKKRGNSKYKGKINTGRSAE